jgi:hypothetical protein
MTPPPPQVSLGALEAFYQKYDPSKLDKVDEIYEKYPAYKLVSILKKKCAGRGGGERREGGRVG